MESTRDVADLDELLDHVRDERTFVAFLQALASDFSLERKLEAESPSNPYGPGKLGWENGTVDAVLEAAAAWAQDGAAPTADTNPWQRCARILYAGKYYE